MLIRFRVATVVAANPPVRLVDSAMSVDEVRNWPDKAEAERLIAAGIAAEVFDAA